MINPNSSGDRSAKGLCSSCQFEPVRCYEIKKRMGGIIREKIALTVPGKVFEGICLECHPHRVPWVHQPEKRGSRRQRQRQEQDPRAVGTTPGSLPFGVDKDEDGSRGHYYSRSASSPIDALQKNRLLRQSGDRNLANSLAQESDTNARITQSLPADFQQSDEADHLQLAACDWTFETEYVEEEVTNMFGETITVRRKGKNHQQKTLQEPHPMKNYQFEDKSFRAETSCPRLPPQKRRENDSEHPPHEQNSGLHHPSTREDSGRLTSENVPSIPDLPQQIDDEEPMDALAQLIAQHRIANPHEQVQFIPGPGPFIPGSELNLPDDSDDLSVMTRETCFGRNSVATNGSRRMSFATEFSETQHHPMISHKINEPTATQDMESILASSSPHLGTLRDLVDDFTQAGADDMAITVVTEALIRDNATAMSVDTASFCLTQLWVFASKSDANKHTIIFEATTFEAIMEAMEIYLKISPEVQKTACLLLWALSMDANDQKHVAQGRGSQIGGCEAILKAMKEYADKDSLQVMALGALKVLSFDSFCKSILRTHGAILIVANIMRKHNHNPKIQSEGCVILGNLAVDKVNKFVVPIGDIEVEAIVMGILAHPRSIEVNEAACFTLVSLASSAANEAVIRQNNKSRVALELAYQNHPNVGIRIPSLLKRLNIE